MQPVERRRRHGLVQGRMGWAWPRLRGGRTGGRTQRRRCGRVERVGRLEVRRRWLRDYFVFEKKVEYMPRFKEMENLG